MIATGKKKTAEYFDRKAKPADMPVKIHKLGLFS
jgi:hypothetical protein